MSIWDTLTDHAKAQFLEVIEWLDDTRDTLVWRAPVFGQVLMDGGKLVVRPGQAAIFVSEGQLSEVFAPGTYELSTRNRPLDSFFQSIKYRLQYPYKGDVYFVNTRRFSDQKWGTSTPFLFEDPQYGGIEVRAYGSYEYKVTDPARLLEEVVGTDQQLTTSEINGQLKRELVEAFRANLKTLAAQQGITVNHLDARFYELKQSFLDGMSPVFEDKYGITLTDFSIGGLNLPDDLRELLNKRREMDMVGDVDRYTRFQAANALRDAAQNQGLGGGMAAAGVGLGVGQVLGAAMGQQQPQGHQGPPPPPPQPGMSPPPPPPQPHQVILHYSGPSGQAELSVPEIAKRVAADPSGTHHVWGPGFPAWKSWDEVPEIVRLVPPPAPPR